MTGKSSKGLILVIDDELGPRESLRFLFKDQYEIICASGVDEGVMCFKQQTPDVVLMDIKMPKKTGIEGLREIRQLDADISIIMLTGFGSLETAQEAIRHGASDYVKKPFDAGEMRNTVQNHINKTHMRRGQKSAYDNLRVINEQLQAELSHKEHMAQLGQATTEFVHDIRNPLTVICGYVSLLMSNIKEGPSMESGSLDTERTREYLEQMEKSVLRCQEMSQMWRDLSQNGGDVNFTACSLTEIINEVCETLQSMLCDAKAGVEIFALDGDLWIQGDNLQIYRAMQNLVSNAVQALPQDGSGRLLIRLSKQGSFAKVEILDNGHGISQDMIETVFNPYVSTKKKKGGMGVGLFITKKVIENHHGKISLSNRVEGGIAAVVEFPLAEA